MNFYLWEVYHAIIDEINSISSRSYLCGHMCVYMNTYIFIYLQDKVFKSKLIELKD